ncbi:MAG: hypothetical protein WC211_00540 [Dehalococcoidia bacterium]
MTLTRRDRKALEHGYECLRDIGEPRIFSAAVNRALGEAVDVLPWSIARPMRELAAQKVPSARLLRARLALALRALLRADAGDCGPWTYRRKPARSVAHADTRECDHRRIDALWSRAPLTGTAIRPAELKRRGGA